MRMEEALIIGDEGVSHSEMDLCNRFPSEDTMQTTSKYQRDPSFVSWCVSHLPAAPLNCRFSTQQ